MGAAEQLDRSRGGSIDERHAAPTPEPIVRLSEGGIIWIVQHIKDEGLGKRRPTVAAGFEENGASAVSSLSGGRLSLSVTEAETTATILVSAVAIPCAPKLCFS